ncbi:hypothetical protein I8752_22800 [Nostocaceae cyanobacterium CENA369]|uniref:Uncharacterized protein n=1 Tax=Dendronalium phyllosphericum CENA369 TaxID=1725256 RepID=A0A8J7LH99_9NOST|nr:hypothetical protein [Dendronalium phyllosphericum]MBH8575779.1 hypothetical protein [Dendronalium phyllosphericum CENA369]
MTDFSDLTKWNLILDSTKNATISGGSIIEPIAPFEPSHLFLSSVVAVQVSSVSAKATWYKAGYLNQAIPVPLSLGLALGESRLISLLTPVIINFLSFTSNYKLSFEVPKYFKDCTLKIWEFTGE